MNGSSVFDQEQLLFPLVWKCVHFYNFIIYWWMFMALSRATCCLQQQHTHKNRSGARNRFTFCSSLGILVCNAYMCTYIYKPHSVLYTNVGVLMILTPSHRWWWSLCLWSSVIHLPLESTKASWGSSSLPPTRKGKGRTESVRKRKRYYLFLGFCVILKFTYPLCLRLALYLGSPFNCLGYRLV